MAELIAVGFQGTHRAAEVLDQLQRLNAEAVVELKDAVACTRPAAVVSTTARTARPSVR